LFHLLLGYLITRALLRLAHWFGRRADGVSRWYASLLNAGTKPFDVVNFAGSSLGGTTMPRSWMLALFDRTIVKLHRRLDQESDADRSLGIHCPTRWDPFFRDYMTVAGVSRFPTPALRLPLRPAHPAHRPLTSPLFRTSQVLKYRAR
jgi:hypothetical protein